MSRPEVAPLLDSPGRLGAGPVLEGDRDLARSTRISIHWHTEFALSVHTSSPRLSLLSGLQYVLLHLPRPLRLFHALPTAQARDPGQELVHRLGSIIRRVHVGHLWCCGGGTVEKVKNQ